MAPLYLVRPMPTGPVALNGVVSVAVPCAAPLTYNVIAPLVESNTPTTCTQVFVAGTVVDLARAPPLLAWSVDTRTNSHRLSVPVYSRDRPEFWVASWSMMPMLAVRVLGL